ncbi:MAG: amidase family protein, partial [Desulfobacterales bacterium]
VGFSIGTETNGSLIAPAMMCGASGLRPTFGRVSRCGAMPVSWSHDKVGPICRSAEDCAIVLRAICGPDPMDRTVIDLPFDWNPDSDLTGLRVGVSRSLFDMSTEDKRLSLILAAHRKAVETIEAMGVGIAEIEDGPDNPMTALVEASSLGMMVESAAAHEDLYFENETGGDVFSHSNWPDRFRAARTVPAVAYVQANRARTLLMEEVGRRMEGIDVLIGRLSLSPLLSNITGHPELVIPHGLDGDGLPIGIVLTGNLFCESAAIRLAHAYQTATGYHLARPGLTR